MDLQASVLEPRSRNRDSESNFVHNSLRVAKPGLRRPKVPRIPAAHRKSKIRHSTVVHGDQLEHGFTIILEIFESSQSVILDLEISEI